MDDGLPTGQTVGQRIHPSLSVVAIADVVSVGAASSALASNAVRTLDSTLFSICFLSSIRLAILQFEGGVIPTQGIEFRGHGADILPSGVLMVSARCIGIRFLAPAARLPTAEAVFIRGAGLHPRRSTAISTTEPARRGNKTITGDHRHG